MTMAVDEKEKEVSSYKKHFVEFYLIGGRQRLFKSMYELSQRQYKKLVLEQNCQVSKTVKE